MSNTKTQENPVIETQVEELRRLEIETKRLELLERAASLQDIEERLAERDMRRANFRLRAVTNGATIKQLNNEKRLKQNRCNHHKGGDGAHGLVAGQGQDLQYAIIKHTMANSDQWVICLRCGKQWKPQDRSAFDSDAAYQEAAIEYKAALRFPTNNKPSSSSQFKWSDGGEFYREAVSNS